MATDTGTWNRRMREDGTGGRRQDENLDFSQSARMELEHNGQTKRQIGLNWKNGSLKMIVGPCGTDLLGVW